MDDPTKLYVPIKMRKGKIKWRMRMRSVVISRTEITDDDEVLNC